MPVLESANQSAFVGQEDVFVPTFTTEETLRFYAHLQLQGASRAQMGQRIDDVLQCMGLCRCRKTQVSGCLLSPWEVVEGVVIAVVIELICPIASILVQNRVAAIVRSSWCAVGGAQ